MNKRLTPSQREGRKKEYYKQYRKTHACRLRDKRREWANENPGNEARYSKEYRERNREKAREASKRYRAKLQARKDGWHLRWYRASKLPKTPMPLPGNKVWMPDGIKRPLQEGESFVHRKSRGEGRKPYVKKDGSLSVYRYPKKVAQK